VYCGRICAFGAFTQLMDAVLPRRLRIEPPRWLERRASWIKFGLLGATLAYYLATKHFAVYRYVEPFWMFTRSADVVLWSMLAALLIATVVVRNLYCRFLCPVGATLGLISKLTVFKIKRWSECKSCTICEKTCEWGAIQGPRIIETECVRCDDCERVYADQQKCPHWLIPVIRSRKIAEAMAAGRPLPTFADTSRRAN
jgi:polyferredoxin